MFYPRSRTTLTLLTLLLIAPSARAYIDAGGSRITLPELLMEFSTAAVMRVDRVDPERGAVRFVPVEILRGKLAEPVVKHLLIDGGKMPDAWRALKPGDPAVFLTDCFDKRSVTLTTAGWYGTASAQPGQDGWERLTGPRPDFSTVFLGTPAELADVARQLFQGRVVVIPHLPSSAKSAAGAASRLYSTADLLNPHARRPALDPARPAPADRPMAKWVEGFASPDVAVALHALLAVRELHSPRDSIAPALVAAMSHPAPEVRALACEVSAATLTPKPAVPALIKCLADSERFVCIAAADALAYFGPAAKDALPALNEALKDRDGIRDYRPWRGAAAARAILRIDPDPKRSAHALKFLVDRMLNDDRPDGYGTRTEGARALASVGPAARPALPALAARLTDPDPATRIEVAHALLAIDPTGPHAAKAREVLKEQSGSKDPLLRRTASPNVDIVKP